MLNLDRDGWIEDGAIQHRSCSHFDDRPEAMAVDTVVIHNISLPPFEFHTSAVEQFFLGTLDFSGDRSLHSLEGVRVSSHFFITRSGKIHQFVSTEKRAWHAGVSRLADRERVNDFSIGIELEGSDFVPFEPVQYLQLGSLIRALFKRYAISAIVAHSDIAPERKTDPGPYFDWMKLMRNEEDFPESCFVGAAAHQARCQYKNSLS